MKGWHFVIACCMEGILVGLFLWVGSAMSAAHIDAITRNNSISAETVLLAENGIAKMSIIISEKASKDTKARAAELAWYLERITGAKFEIKTNTNGPGILVGTIADFPTPSAVEGLKIFDVYDGRDAYAIRTEDGCVKLLGATDFGVSHAVSRFLELLGCRWFFPGPTWEIVPKIDKLTFNINETDRPEVLGMHFGYDLGQQYEKDDPDAGEATKAWYRRNRLAMGFRSAAGHCAHVIVSRFHKEFEAHPEYRALIEDKDGKRFRTGTQFSPTDPRWQWGQLCVSNPEVVKLACQYADEYFDKNPNAEMVGIGPDDGGGWCLCSECAKLGDYGNQAFYLANQVAKHIQKTHPGKLVGLLAYNWHADPPDFPLEPNVYVELTTTLILNTKYGFDKLLELWPKKCKYVGLYDYWAVYDWTRDNMPSGRTGNLKYVAEKIPSYIKHGIVCMRAESGNSWGSQGLGYYLAIHLMWNTSADVDALKNDFYQKAFGPAAKEMKAYYELTDLGNTPLVGPTFYRMCCDYFEAAEKAAAGHPDVLARIEQLKQYNVYVYLLNKERDTTLPPEERKKWAFETLKWNYRIRNTYMTFWSFFAGMTTAQWAKEFNEPTWNWYDNYWVQRKPEQIPYRDPKPITPEETARWFQQMKRDFGTVPKVTAVNFSKNLVAPEWVSDSPNPPRNNKVIFHGPFTMVLASMKGEPLRFSMNHGTMYPKNPPGDYVLTDMSGKEIARGTIPICPQTPTEIELKVPSAGVYYFKFDDHGGGTAFMPAQGLRAAFVPEGPRGYTLLWNTWFYVPKGTTEIQFAASCGGIRFGIKDPDGKWVECNRPNLPAGSSGLNFRADGYYYTIPVPKGMDGRMWGMSMAQCGFHMRFFNIPTIFCLSSDGPIIPEEVAKMDGLKW